MKTAKSIFAVLVLYMVPFLSVRQVSGQVSQIAPEWKAHFKATPVIENCVFECQGNGQTNLYQFKWQENAFLFRQIRSLDDVSSNNIPMPLGLTSYVGRYDSNCWRIGGTPDTFGELTLHPNAKNIWRKMPRDGDGEVFAVYLGGKQLFTALYYGIFNLDPATVEWPEESKFTALNVDGQKVLGEIISVSNGLPTVLEWRIEDAPDQQFRFVMEYKYDASFDLPYFPSEIQLSSKIKGQKQLRWMDKILMLKTSATPLGKSFFDPYRYFVIPPPSQYPRINVVCYSNNTLYSIKDGGRLEKMPLLSALPPLENGEANKAHAKFIRFFLLGLFVVSAIGLLFILKHTKTSNKTSERNDQ